MKKKSANKTLTKQHKKDKQAVAAAVQAQLQKLGQQEAVVAQQKLKVDGAAEGIEAAVRELTKTMPRLFRDKTVMANLKSVYKAKLATASEDEAFRAVGNWFLQKVVLGLSDMAGDYGKQSKMLSGSLSIIRLEKENIGGQDGGTSGKVKS